MGSTSPITVTVQLTDDLAGVQQWLVSSQVLLEISPFKYSELLVLSLERT